MTLPIWFRALRPGLAGAALVVLATACAGYIQPAGEGTVWVTVGPPSPRREVRSQAPGPEFIWVSGYDRWNGQSYDWVPGRWERAPQPRAHWVEGRWYHERRGWYYVEGHWDRR